MTPQESHAAATRGFFGIGIYHCKTSENVGTLWRSALLFGASFIFTIGRRYKKQASDTTKATRHIPLYHYRDWDDFKAHVPYTAQMVMVEQGGTSLPDFTHPQQAVYLLGAEDHGLPVSITRGRPVVEIPTRVPRSMNVATAGSIVMYDRLVKVTP